MDRISAADVLSAMGEVEDLVLSELIRTEATANELRQAMLVARSTRTSDGTGEVAVLSAHMQRLVDLCSVGTSRPDPGSRLKASFDAA